MAENNEEYLGMPLNTYCMAIHLSSIVIPVLGVFLPIVLWFTQKDESEAIDEHGKLYINWLASVLTYILVLFLFPFSVLTFYLLVLLVVLHFVFTIIAAIKAKQGKFWTYPLSMRFLR